MFGASGYFEIADQFQFFCSSDYCNCIGSSYVCSLEILFYVGLIRGWEGWRIFRCSLVNIWSHDSGNWVVFFFRRCCSLFLLFTIKSKSWDMISWYYSSTVEILIWLLMTFTVVFRQQMVLWAIFICFLQGYGSIVKCGYRAELLDREILLVSFGLFYGILTISNNSV